MRNGVGTTAHDICRIMGDVQKKNKKPFAGTIELMLEAKMDKYLSYASVLYRISYNLCRLPLNVSTV